MLNDGSAIVLYEILWDIIGGHEHSGNVPQYRKILMVGSISKFYCGRRERVIKVKVMYLKYSKS